MTVQLSVMVCDPDSPPEHLAKMDKGTGQGALRDCQTPARSPLQRARQKRRTDCSTTAHFATARTRHAHPAVFAMRVAVRVPVPQDTEQLPKRAPLGEAKRT